MVNLIGKLIAASMLLVASNCATASSKCNEAFKRNQELSVISCDKGKIELEWQKKGKVAKANGSIVTGDDAYLEFDLKISKGFIEPANTGRYVTKVDSRNLLRLDADQIQVINSKYIFGDGEHIRTNLYYACKIINFSKCLTLEFINSSDKKKELQIVSRLLEIQW
jgi:hypothetical protein